MIYVLIPARDEAATVGLLLWKVRQAFTGFSREYQIIVVNDGSRDASDEVLAPYTRALPLTLLNHREPKGYARSLEELLRAAVQRTDRPRRDLAVTLQADFSDSPEDLVELVKRLEAGADIAVPDRRTDAWESRTSRLAHRALNALLRRRLGLPKVSDFIGTMRAYRLAVIERLVRQHGTNPFITGDRWTADLHLLARASRHARAIDSVPLSGQRPHTARSSRATPVRSAWAAWSSSSALARELKEPLPPLQPLPPHEPVEAKPERPRREERRGGNRQRQRQHEKQPRTPKAETATATAAEEPSTPSTPATPATPAAEVSSSGPGDTPKRRRRRRGRGRGRGGRREGGESSGDSNVSSPSAA